MHIDDQEFMAEFEQVFGMGDKKKSVESQNGGDFLSNLLSITKNNPKPIV